MITVGADTSKNNVIMHLKTLGDVYLGSVMARHIASQLNVCAEMVDGLSDDTTEEFSNETTEDARQLIADAREGSFDNASIEFLNRLRQELQTWIVDVEKEIAKKNG